jgi:hypothetical protein
MLREDLGIANSSLLAERERAERNERQLEVERQLVEDGRKRIDELQASLTEERRQIDRLNVDLADAVSAERIAAGEAAALRAIVTGLRARPWWRRRWFR